MTLRSEQETALDGALMNALLHQIYQGDADEQRRIDFVLAELEQTKAPARSGANNKPSTWRRWVSVAIAAGLLLAATYSISYFTTGNAAYAAVMRSLQVPPTTRAYRIRMVHQRPAWGKREVTADLYLNDHDQFVIRHPGWSGFGDVWIGGDSKDRWLAPRFGPALVGDKTVISGWLSRKDIPSLYLHVSTVLERMSRNYQLQMVDDVPLNDVDAPGTTVLCQHIVGTRRGQNRVLPKKIELWAELGSAMARRVEVTWERDAQERGPLSWTIDLAAKPEVPSNWFALKGHISEDRKIRTIKSTAELDAAEKVSP